MVFWLPAVLLVSLAKPVSRTMQLSALTSVRTAYACTHVNADKCMVHKPQR